MTLQNSCFKNFGVNRKLLWFNFRQNWPFLIASTLICFCGITIPTVLSFSASASYFEDVFNGFVERYYTPAMRVEYILEETINFVRLDGFFIWVLACCFALVAGIISIRFLNNKIGVNFWHSVPVKRENLVINDLLVYSAYFLAALAMNILLEGIIVFSFVGKYLSVQFGAQIVSALFSCFGIAVLLFFFVYSVMLFAASLTGSDFMRFATGLLILFYPLAAYSSFIGGMMLFSHYTQWDYYLEEEFLIRFSPIIRLFAVDRVPLAWYTVVLIVCFTFAFLFLAVFLYKRRKSESAGTPVIYRVAAGIIKYSVVTVATILGGLFFYVLYYNFFWLIFGLVLGAFLSFMIVNSVLYKSPKAMFRNLKGLAVFGGCFLVFFAVFIVDIFGFDRYVPKWNIREITIDVEEYSFSCDGDEAKEFLEIFDDLIEKHRGDAFAPPETEKNEVTIDFETSYGKIQEYFYYSYDYTSVSLTINRDIGFPVKKRVTIPSSSAGELLNLAEENLRQAQLERVRASDVLWVDMDLGHAIDLYLDPSYYQDFEVLHMFLSKLRASLKEDPVAPVVGNVSFNGKNGYYTYDLYASDYDAILYALGHFAIDTYSEFYDKEMINTLLSGVDSPTAFLRGLSRQYEFVLVYDWETDSYIVYEDPEEIYSVLLQCTQCTEYSTSVGEELYYETDRAYSVAFGDVNLLGHSYLLSTQLIKDGNVPSGQWIKN